MRFENLIYAGQYKSTAAEQIYIARIYESLLQTVHTNANSTAAFSRRGFKISLSRNTKHLKNLFLLSIGFLLKEDSYHSTTL